MKRYRPFQLILSFVLLLSLAPINGAGAQESQPSGPVYIVQPGDTLWDIAQRFGVSMDELANANGITDAGRLSAGDQLVIPRLEGIQGVLVTKKITYGETLRSLSRRYRVPESALVRLNHLASPVELYAGANLIIPENSAQESLGKRVTLSPGQSLLELAVIQGVNPWYLVLTNSLSGTWDTLPGDVLRLAGEDTQGPGGLPEQISSIALNPLPLVQGKTTVISITATTGVTLTGSLLGHDLHFFQEKKGKYLALQGVHAMTDPGLYPLELSGALPDGTPVGFSQMVQIEDGGYIKDRSIAIDPAGLDPALTKPEDTEWFALATPATPDKLWDGVFQFPAQAVYLDCYPSTFGRRRSYNDSPYIYFHTGLDVCGGVGDDIYAPAAGVVVFAGPLTVRGNATMIDHGWGVYTGYMHQSEILVKAGDRVEAGQVIGKVGRTGLRVTGPHLHFEVLVGGVQVEPLDWLQQSYP